MPLNVSHEHFSREFETANNENAMKYYEKYYEKM